MRKIILSGCLFLFALIAVAQSEENGKIYIKHPNIDAVNNSMKAYNDGDMAAFAGYFADTAKVWFSGLEKPIALAAAIKEWSTDKDYYDSIKIIIDGYPDYLHYKDKDQKYVQSWWTLTGKSKKTGEIIKIEFVQFDKFNSAGQIEKEYLYGDFSKMVKN